MSERELKLSGNTWFIRFYPSWRRDIMDKVRPCYTGGYKSRAVAHRRAENKKTYGSIIIEMGEEKDD